MKKTSCEPDRRLHIHILMLLTLVYCCGMLMKLNASCVSTSFLLLLLYWAYVYDLLPFMRWIIFAICMTNVIYLFVENDKRNRFIGMYQNIWFGMNWIKATAIFLSKIKAIHANIIHRWFSLNSVRYSFRLLK